MPYPGGGNPANRETASLVVASFRAVRNLDGVLGRGALTAWCGPEILYGNWDATMTTTINVALSGPETARQSLGRGDFTNVHINNTK